MTSDLQFGRRCGLVVYNAPTYSQAPSASAATGSTLTSTQGTGTATPGNGLDLSEMRIRFRISQSDVETPNTAVIRVYNLSDQTVKKVRGEFQRVTLQGGYENGNYGVIFDGTIKQVLSGHETNIDSYVDIFAADGDIPYNNGIVNTSLAAGSTPQQQVAALAASMNVPVGYTQDLPVTALGRGKVMFGLSRDQLRRVSQSALVSWSIQNGQLVMIPLSGYRAGDAVVLTAATGLIGFPQQTPGGIEATALLNPRIRIGTLVQIDNAAINQGSPNVPGAFLYGADRLDKLAGFNARISDDGFYKVLVHEMEGDTRGEPWFSYLTCLAVDRSAPVNSAVNPYYAGGPA